VLGNTFDGATHGTQSAVAEAERIATRRVRQFVTTLGIASFKPVARALKRSGKSQCARPEISAFHTCSERRVAVVGAGALIARWTASFKGIPVMRLAAFCLCSILLAGCASQRIAPVASADSVTETAPKAAPGTEVRHMYLFAPGKAPVKIVMLEDGTASEDHAWSSDHGAGVPDAEQ